MDIEEPDNASSVTGMFLIHREFFIGLREIALAFVNLLEVNLGIFPTTSQIRREYKKGTLHKTDKGV